MVHGTESGRNLRPVGRVVVILERRLSLGRYRVLVWRDVGENRDAGLVAGDSRDTRLVTGECWNARLVAGERRNTGLMAGETREGGRMSNFCLILQKIYTCMLM